MKKMKGIILAAGKGTRLYPATEAVCKPLLTVYDKPMIYYPLSLMIDAGIRDIMIIIPPGEEERFEKLLGDGSHLGISIRYKIQYKARGIGDAFIIGRDFIERDKVCLALGDNIFYHENLSDFIRKAGDIREGASVFGCWSENPEAFGVVEFDEKGTAVSLEEKPQRPRSHYVVPGLYFYGGAVVERAARLLPSARGELEITDINRGFLEEGRLKVTVLPKDTVWFDAGTAEGVIKAGVKIMELQKNGRYIGCVEEAAYRRGFICRERLEALGRRMKASDYGRYVAGIARGCTG